MTLSRRKLSLLLAAAAALACIIAIAQFGSPAHAQAASPGGGTPACSDAKVQGTYVYYQGTSAQISGNSKSPFAVAGVEVYDGQGHDHGVFSQSVNGKITSQRSYTGTYTVNPDCTGTEVDTDTTGAVSHYDQYYLPSGNEFTFLQSDSGTVSSGIETRAS